MARRWLSLFTILFAISGSSSNSQQRAASIQGIVIGSEDAPLGKVTVELRVNSASATGEGAVVSTQTDGEGKFYLPSVPPGSYHVVATTAGYVRSEYGQQNSGGQGQILTIAAGQVLKDIRLTMTKGGVISGRITEKGEPVALADVVAVRPIYIEGQLSFTPVLADRTNDLGEYNLFWLPPGRYYIVAILWDTASAVGFYVNPDGSDISPFWAQRMESRAVFMRTLGTSIAENEAHVPFYYPGTTDPQAARTVEVQAGANLHGIDVNAAPMQTYRVSGKVTGLATNRATINMRPMGASLNTNAAQTPTVQTDPAGNFEIQKAIAGRYALIAVAGNLSGRIPLEIRDRDATNIVVPLATGFKVSGRVVIERQNSMNPDPAMANLRVTLRTDPLLPGAPSLTVTPGTDGSFTIPMSANPSAQPAAAPPAGEYRVLVNPILIPPLSPEATPSALPPTLQNAYVKSIRFGDVDVLNDGLRLQSQSDDALVIVIGTNPGSIEGRITGQRQSGAATTVVLIHVDALRYRVNEKFAFSDSTGRFVFDNVAPGSYKLFAWEKIDRSAWNDPGVMQEYESYGVPIRIEEGKKQSVDLIVIP